MVSDQPQKWIEWIYWVEFSYNTSIHSFTKMTPFEVVYNISLLGPQAYVSGISHIETIDEYLRDRDAILRELKHNLLLAHNRMK